MDFGDEVQNYKTVELFAFEVSFLENIVKILKIKFQSAKTTFTVLEETVRAGSGNLDIMKHDMIQKIIEVKWRQFGRRGKYH